MLNLCSYIPRKGGEVFWRRYMRCIFFIEMLLFCWHFCFIFSHYLFKISILSILSKGLLLFYVTFSVDESVNMIIDWCYVSPNSFDLFWTSNDTFHLFVLLSMLWIILGLSSGYYWIILAIHFIVSVGELPMFVPSWVWGSMLDIIDINFITQKYLIIEL